MSNITDVIKQSLKAASKYLYRVKPNLDEKSKTKDDEQKDKKDEKDSKSNKIEHYDRFKGLLPGPSKFAINGTKRVFNGGKLK